MKADEQMVQIAELESCVEKATMEADRRLMQQQQEYERRIQLLMKQLTQAESGGHNDLAAEIKAKEARWWLCILCVEHSIISPFSFCQFILLGLGLYRPSASVSLIFMVLYT